MDLSSPAAPTASRRLKWSYAVLFLGAISNGYDGALINGLLALPPFLTVLDVSASYQGLIIASIALGGLCFFFPAAWLADHIGRRKTAAFGAAIMAIAGIVQGLTTGPLHLLLTRLFIGFGLAFTQVSCNPLLNELARPQSRPVVGSGYNSSYYLGAITSAWVTFGTLASLSSTNSWAWRIPCLVQSIFPLALVLGLLFVVPESPRYLMAKGRDVEAHKLLTSLHGSLVANQEFGEIKAALGRQSTSFSYLDFLRSPANRWRLFIIVTVGLMVQWAGQGPLSYYFSPILESLGVASALQRSALNGGLQVWNAFFAAGGALVTERLGRRPLWLISAIGMLISEIVVTICFARYTADPSDSAAGYAAIVFLFFLFAAYDVGMTPLNFQYITEILPYHSRTKGLALNQWIVFAAGFFNQYVNPIALDNLSWRYYIVFIVLLTIYTAVIWLTYPETKGRSLESVEVLFDHEGASLSQLATWKGVRGLQRRMEQEQETQTLASGSQELTPIPSKGETAHSSKRSTAEVKPSDSRRETITSEHVSVA